MLINPLESDYETTYVGYELTFISTSVPFASYLMEQVSKLVIVFGDKSGDIMDITRELVRNCR